MAHLVVFSLTGVAVRFRLKTLSQSEAIARGIAKKTSVAVKKGEEFLISYGNQFQKGWTRKKKRQEKGQQNETSSCCPEH